MKRLIVIWLEKSCSWLDQHIIDRLPEKIQMHWNHKPALLSLDLSDKWHVEEWE